MVSQIQSLGAKKTTATMSNPDDHEAFESGLVRQLADIERKITELSGERDALKRLIVRVRRQNMLQRDVTRKNSLDRILIENRILEVLREAGDEAVYARELFAQARNIHYQLKETTFRSHLHRLKSKGLIMPHPFRGRWMLTGRAAELDAKSNVRKTTSAVAKKAPRYA
jgi:DNA-binding transcriptional ArsR family regulator